MQNRHKLSHSKIMFWGLVEMVIPCCIQNSEGRLSTTTGQAQSANPALSVFPGSSFHMLGGATCSLVFWKSMGCAVGTSFCWLVLHLLVSSHESFFLLSHPISPALPSSASAPRLGSQDLFSPYFLYYRTSPQSCQVDIMLNLTECFPAFFADESSHL